MTPEYPGGTYYYVMTDNWPYIPRCFYGTVIDNTFRIGPNCPDSNADINCSEQVVTNIVQIENAQVSIAPNPSSTSLRILSTDPSIYAKITQVSIYDLNGRVSYFSKQFNGEIDISKLGSGHYFLQIDFAGTQVTKKIIVQK